MLSRIFGHLCTVTLMHPQTQLWSNEFSVCPRTTCVLKASDCQAVQIICLRPFFSPILLALMLLRVEQEVTPNYSLCYQWAANQSRASLKREQRESYWDVSEGGLNEDHFIPVIL